MTNRRARVAGGMSTPMRRTRSPCCARAASGHAAAPPRSVMNVCPPAGDADDPDRLCERDRPVATGIVERLNRPGGNSLSLSIDKCR